MDDLDFYNEIANPINGLTQETIEALVKLFHRVENLEQAIARAALKAHEEANNE